MKEELIDILLEIKSKITDTSEMMWTTYDTPQDLNKDIDNFIFELDHNNLEVMKDINTHFLPTGTFQEHAMQNGWTDEYMNLAARFDKFYAELKF
jgi:hypothetical protein